MIRRRKESANTTSQLGKSKADSVARNSAWSGVNEQPTAVRDARRCVGTHGDVLGRTAMCWDAEPTQPLMTSLERCTIAPGRLHPQPHPSRRLCALFFLSPPTRPGRMSRSAHAQAPLQGLSILPLPLHRLLGSLIPRLPPGLAALAASHATCDESRLAPHIDTDAQAKQQRWQVPHVDTLELRQQRRTSTSSPSTHRWPTSWCILLAPQTIKDTRRAAGKKERSDATQGPVVSREGCEDSSVCLRLPMLFHLARVRHRPAALSPALSATRSLLRTRCPSPLHSIPIMLTPLPKGSSFPIPTSPACPPARGSQNPSGSCPNHRGRWIVGSGEGR
ncbi:hypothetical protein B0H14DRAFT_3495008 [Mycena olivaceomarginata]|nr:hypothetical protein B0H14DRAFT_3495008 [Mycena olivaceomarginata]